jgi:hypothetical protein
MRDERSECLRADQQTIGAEDFRRDDGRRPTHAYDSTSKSHRLHGNEGDEMMEPALGGTHARFGTSWPDRRNL